MDLFNNIYVWMREALAKCCESWELLYENCLRVENVNSAIFIDVFEIYGTNQMEPKETKRDARRKGPAWEVDWEQIQLLMLYDTSLEFWFIARRLAERFERNLFHSNEIFYYTQLVLRDDTPKLTPLTVILNCIHATDHEAVHRTITIDSHFFFFFISPICLFIYLFLLFHLLKSQHKEYLCDFFFENVVVIVWNS